MFERTEMEIMRDKNCERIEKEMVGMEKSWRLGLSKRTNRDEER